MNHIFISHSHEDLDFAATLHERLVQEGFSVWRDTGIGGGEDWRREIDQAIQAAFALIVIMTSEAKASEYVTYEWAFALGAAVKVIPILLTRTELHPRLESLQYLDFANENARPWDKLVESLNKARPSKLQEEQPGYRVHGYSGVWEVEIRFSRWRGYELRGNDTVYFHGKTFLLLSADGRKGSGTESGKLYVSISNYKATYEIANRVNRANATEDGTLHLYVEVLSRTLIDEKGELPETAFGEKLFGSGELHNELTPVSGEFRRLKGQHTYLAGNKVFQEAEGFYQFLGV
jgi:hypothetical protein